MADVKKFMAIVLSLMDNNKCNIYKVMLHVPAHKDRDYWDGPLKEVAEKEIFTHTYLIVSTGATWNLQVESTWGGGVRLRLENAARLQKPSGTHRICGADIWHSIYKGKGVAVKFFRGEELTRTGLLRNVIRTINNFKPCLTGFEG